MARTATIRQGRKRDRRDDRTLADLAAGGDRDAFDVLHDRHEPIFAGYLATTAVSADDVADVLQNAFAIAWENPQTRRPDGDVELWLFGIVRNEVSRHRRDLHPITAELDDTWISPAAGPAETFAAKVTFRETMNDVASLPTTQRHALLPLLDGRDDAETAATRNTTEVAIRRARTDAVKALTLKQQGRLLPCSLIQEVTDRGDRRELRRRDVTAHLDDCSPCAAHAQACARRKRYAIRAFVPAGLITLARRLLPHRILSTTRRIALTGAPAKTGVVALVAVTAITIAHAHHHHHPAHAAARTITATVNRPRTTRATHHAQRHQLSRRPTREHERNPTRHDHRSSDATAPANLTPPAINTPQAATNRPTAPGQSSNTPAPHAPPANVTANSLPAATTAAAATAAQIAATITASASPPTATNTPTDSHGTPGRVDTDRSGTARRPRRGGMADCHIVSSHPNRCVHAVLPHAARRRA